MWILVVTSIELIRFCCVLGALRYQGLFEGWFGFATYLVLDQLFFFVVLEVVDHYFHIFPSEKWRQNTRLGNYLRKRINFSVQTLDNSEIPEPAFFACHSHGILATAQLLAFMMYPKSCPELGDFGAHTISMVSSQMWMFPLTSVVCRLLAARPVSELKNLVATGNSVVELPGGTTEMAISCLDTATKLHIVMRVGFLKLCYEQKRPIVPILVLGNYTMFDIVTHPILEWIQGTNSAILGYGLPILALGTYGSILPKAGASVQLLRLPTVRPDPGVSEKDFIRQYYEALSTAASERGIQLVTCIPEQR